MKTCSHCQAPLDADSNFCDQCGTEVPAPVVQTPAVIEKKPKRGGWQPVFWTQDIGEKALIHSYLQNEGILCRASDEFAERYSLWSTPFFRTFSLAVPVAMAPRARRLLKKYQAEKPETLPPLSRRLFAGFCLALFIFLLVMSILVQVRS